MNTKSQSHVLSLAAVLLVLSSSAVYFGKSWHQQLAPLQLETARLHTDQSRLTGELAQLKTELNQKGQSQSVKPLQAEFLTAISAISESAKAHSVSLSLPVVSSMEGKSLAQNSQITSVAQSVGGSDLKTLRVNFKGEYQYYDQLQEFLKSVQTSSRVITYLKLDKTSLEFSVLIFGE